MEMQSLPHINWALLAEKKSWEYLPDTIIGCVNEHAVAHTMNKTHFNIDSNINTKDIYLAQKLAEDFRFKPVSSMVDCMVTGILSTVFVNDYGVIQGMPTSDSTVPTTEGEEPSQRVVFNIDSINQEQVLAFAQLFKKYTFTKTTNEGEMNVLVQGMDGYDLSSIGRAAVEFEPKNYSKVVRTAYDKIISELTVPEPMGRITILEGFPGTGKTFLIRSVLSNVENARFIIVPPHLLPKIGDPGMIKLFIQLAYYKQPIILVLEDADDLLVKRSHDTQLGISALLNLSDGIVGRQLDLRTIATTNQTITEMDPAVMRPGRLSQYIHVGQLDMSEAMECFNHHTDAEFITPVGKTVLSLAEVYEMINKSKSTQLAA